MLLVKTKIDTHIRSMLASQLEENSASPRTMGWLNFTVALKSNGVSYNCL